VQPLSEQKEETSASAKAERQWYRSVGLRTLTSIIAIPVVLAFVWFGGWWAFAASAIVVILGTYELHTMMLHEGYHPLIVVSLVLSLLFVVAAMIPQERLVLLSPADYLPLALLPQETRRGYGGLVADAGNRYLSGLAHEPLSTIARLSGGYQ
jgi:hypothetical protein